MNTFVLIPGAWLGAEAWAEVAEALRGSGAQVLPISLPGLGERTSEATAETDMEGYVNDVIAQILDADLRDVTLVGHSYGGSVASAVADRVSARLASVIYVDSGPLPSGSSYIDFLDSSQQDFVNELVQDRGEGWLVPMPEWEEFGTGFAASLDGLGVAERRLMRAGAAPQPLKTWTQPVTRRDGAEVRCIPKVLISCSFPTAEVKELIAAGHPWFAEMSGPEWTFEELPTGHWPMFSRPQDLARLLLEVTTAKTG
ncbi:MAG TPA: alpha/beta hydrolase [Acidimicrobiia bacterium]|nr:alpha/beta hydrolase [Acidimicrobiia bacterium]